MVLRLCDRELKLGGEPARLSRMSHAWPDSDVDGREERNPFIYLLVLAGALVFAAFAYLAFTALEHSRRFQRCLDAGDRNCVGFVDSVR